MFDTLDSSKLAHHLSINKSGWSAISDSAPRARVAFFGDEHFIRDVFAAGRFEQIARISAVHPDVVSVENLDAQMPFLRDIEVIFGTWGLPALTAKQLDRMPNLRAVFFAAGSVNYFARPFLERNVMVVSSWQANAIPVAEFTLGQILLSAKGYFRNSKDYDNSGALTTAFRGPGVYGETIALLGCGAIGSKVAEILKNFNLEVIVYDPFLSQKRAAELNVRKVSLAAAFSRGYVVSNHLADTADTRAMLSESQFSSMRENATFINTGRGATVDEGAMISVLSRRQDLTALLDVTYPEPPAPGSPLFRMPNIRLSTHIAGSLGTELLRMADFCIRDFVSWQNGGTPEYAVSLQQLETMA